MGLKTNCYAKVWSVQQRGNVCSAKISVSRKNSQTGKYENSFNDFVTFGGEAAKKAIGLGLPERGDRTNPTYRSIKITSSPDLTSYYNKERSDKLLSMANGNDEFTKFIKQHMYQTNVTIWDFELADGSSDNKNQSSQLTAPPDEDMGEDDLPF